MEIRPPVGPSEKSSEALDAEAPAAAMIEPITPAGPHFVRSHFPPPSLDHATHRLRIDGAVAQPGSFSLADLRKRARRTGVVTLECAGNGRRAFTPPTPGEPWGERAVSTAIWTGVSLRDLLDDAVVRDDVREVLFEGADRGAPERGHMAIPYQRSLPIDVALDRDTLIAFEMNGGPIPRRHGGPVRLIVPGWYGMASVKWLERIEPLARPFDGFFQRERYQYDDSDRVAPEP